MTGLSSVLLLPADGDSDRPHAASGLDSSRPSASGPVACPAPIGAEGLLENYANNSSLLARRTSRYARRVELWQVSDLRRLKKCGRVMTCTHVTVRKTGPVAGLAGLVTCGSVWACPVCNAKIMARRAVEIGAAVALWQAQGGRVAFETFTMRHRRGQGLAELWEALGKAWARITSGKYWRAEQQRYGIAGWLRVVEVTTGKNGWHVHVHALLFLSGAMTPADLLGLHAGMFGRWSRSLVRSGLEAPLVAGQDARLITGPADESLSSYFTKATDGAHRIGLEFTQTQSKTSRTSLSTVSVWSVLDSLLNTGLVDFLDQWHEWERASKGRKQLTWSQGFRAGLLLDAEQTDEQLAEQEVGSKTDDLVAITADGWAGLVRRPELVAYMLTVTEQAGMVGLQGFLAAYGVEHEVVG